MFNSVPSLYCAEFILTRNVRAGTGSRASASIKAVTNLELKLNPPEYLLNHITKGAQFK